MCRSMQEIDVIRKLRAELISATYCTWYPHAMLFLWNKNPLFSTKNSNNTCLGEFSVINILNLKKKISKNPEVCPFTGLFHPFWVIPHACPLLE